MPVVSSKIFQADVFSVLQLSFCSGSLHAIVLAQHRVREGRKSLQLGKENAIVDLDKEVRGDSDSH